MNALNARNRFPCAIVLLIAFSFLSALVAGAPLVLTPDHVEADACICDTSVTAFTASNPSADMDNYVFAIAGSAPWGNVAPLSVSIGGGQSSTVYAYVTPNCFASPGAYSFTLTGKSTTTQAQSTIELVVSPCVSLNAQDLVQKLCAGDKKSFVILLKNKSRTADKTYSIALSGTAANAVDAPQKVLVKSGGEASATLTIDATKLAPGKYSLGVKAVSVYEATGQPTQDKASLEFSVVVDNCQQITLATTQEAIDKAANACINEEFVVPLNVTNYGAVADKVSLSASESFASLNAASVDVPANSSVVANAVVKAPKGVYEVTFTAKSSLGSSKQLVLSVNSRDCYGAVLSVKMPASFCSEEGSNLTLVLKNTGVKDTFTIVSSLPHIKLSKSQVVLGENEEIEIPAEIPLGITPGNYSVTFRAMSGKASAQNSTHLEVQDCFNVRLVGEDAEICQCSTKGFPFNVVNIGTHEDTYYIVKESGPDWLLFNNMDNITILSQQKRTLVPVTYTCDAEPAVYPAVFDVLSYSHSSHSKDKLCVNITVRSASVCYRALLQSSDEEFVEECTTKIVPVTITNNGLEKNTYSLEVEGTSWAMLNPDFVVLEKNEAKVVYLTFSPPLNTANKSFEVVVKAVSRGITSSKAIKVNVVSVGSLPANASQNVSLKPLPAEVSYAEGLLTVNTLPATSVKFFSPTLNYSARLDSGSQGIAAVSVNESSEWQIDLFKEGYVPLSLAYNASVPSGFTGLFVLDTTSTLALLVTFVLAAAVLYALYYFTRSKPKTGRKYYK